MHVLYQLDYYERMLRNNSTTSEQISYIRWEFLIANITDPIRVLLDFGSGVGWFRAHRPLSIEVDSFDIGSYPQTGILHKEYDVVCLWDVLEHIANFELIHSILNSTRYVALTIPIKPRKTSLACWKHYKPGEHLHYFTLDELDTFFETYGFRLLKRGKPECPPREDVWSLLYEKENGKADSAKSSVSG